MIVLCPTHHAIVDKQTGRYDEAELRRLKAEHEGWVKRRGPDVPRVRVRDPAAGTPMVVHRVTTGGEIMGITGPGEAMLPGKPDDLEADEVELLADFFEDVTDWSDIWSEIGPGGRLRAEYGITQQLDELRAAGFVVYAGVRPQILEGGVGEPMRWRLAVIGVYRAGDEPIADSRLVLPI
jgi:hypothetical protein